MDTEFFLTIVTSSRADDDFRLEDLASTLSSCQARPLEERRRVEYVAVGSSRKRSEIRWEDRAPSGVRICPRRPAGVASGPGEARGVVECSSRSPSRSMAGGALVFFRRGDLAVGDEESLISTEAFTAAFGITVRSPPRMVDITHRRR